MGSAAARSDSSGTGAWRAYYPSGELRTSSGTIAGDRSFTGQRLDTPTGLYFYNARYYDSDLGRFISPDSLVPDPYDPRNYNRFAYVMNNPLKHIDPSGNRCIAIDEGDGSVPDCGAGVGSIDVPDRFFVFPSRWEDSIPISGGGRVEIEYYYVVNNPVIDAAGDRLFPTAEQEITVRFYVTDDCRGAAHCAFGRGDSFAPPGDHVNMQREHVENARSVAHEIYHHVEQGGWCTSSIVSICGEFLWFKDYVKAHRRYGYDNNPFEDRAGAAGKLAVDPRVGFQVTIVTIERWYR
ncbi:MAG: RHS repeat-associated core domain-containing protein [Chloroflexi bacterium]|nr:RHS repeat-associated core domain-containing protein [Chloroflexota bacterium]